MLSSVIYDDISVGQKFSNGSSTYKVIFAGQASDGYRGAVFENVATREIVVSNGGTQLTDIHDVISDFAMGPGSPPPQWVDAVNLTQWAQQYAIENGYGEVTTTGHSLGGALAQLLAAKFGIRAETFNAYGAYDIALRLDLNPSAVTDLVKNHRDAFDPISSISDHIGSSSMYMSLDEYNDLSVYGFEGTLRRSWDVAGAHGIGNFWDGGDPGKLFGHNYIYNLNLSTLSEEIKNLSDELKFLFSSINNAIRYNLLGGVDVLIEELMRRLNSDSSYRIVRYDPLALDLDGDGIVSTRADANWSGPLFDNDGDGIRAATGWIDAGDGLLVRDIDGNGLIDSGRELFGDRTLLADGTNAHNGFAALAAMDSNGDGQVDATDADFSSMRVWRDVNGNGTTEAGELLSLSELGIVSLSVAPTDSSNKAVAGGTLTGTGSYTRMAADGSISSQVMQEFDFDNDALHSKYTDAIEVPESLMELANIPGMGKLRDLREACVISPELQQRVRDFSTATTRGGQRGLLEGLLLEWARTNPTFQEGTIVVHAGGAYEDPNSTNVVRLLPGQVVSWPDDFVLDAETARKVRVVEAIIGSAPITEIWWGSATVDQYLKVYNTFFEGSYSALAMQTRLKSYTDLIGIQWSLASAEGIAFDFSGVVARLEEKFAVDQTNALADLIDLIGASPVISGNKGAFVNLLGSWVDRAGTDGLGQALAGLYPDRLLGNGTLSFAMATPPAGSGVVAGVFLFGTVETNTLSGGDGDDVVIGAVGNDTLNGGAGTDELLGNAGDDILNGGNGNDVLLGGAGNDHLYAGNGNDVLDGGAGDDVLDGGNNGANQLLGGAGNDVLNTGAYANGNVLVGSTGDDVLNGSAYSDTYVFNLGDGRDVITENWSWGGTDTLRFGAGIAATDLSVLRTGNDLVLVHANGTDQVTVKNWFANGWNTTAFLDTISFADGTSWTPGTLTAMEITLTGTPSGETLNGWDGKDRLMGDAGDDTLNGGNGNDMLLGGEGNDRLNAGNGNDTLDGGVGDDVLDGGNNGANRLLGGAGNDVLNTGAYANGNVLAGGIGDDVLNGSAYSDTYVFNLGDGRDVITENWSWGGGDTLQFGAGIAAADMSVLRSGNDLVLVHTNGTDQVTVKNWFANGWNATAFMDTIIFADGTVWTPSTLAGREIELMGTASAETLNGWDGRDRLIGDAGDDILSGGNGSDVLLGGEGNDRLYAGNGNDVLDGGAGDDVLDGGNNGANQLLGGAGNDVLNTGAYANGNVLAGGIGDDILNGSAYSDTYMFNLGDGRDVITENWSWGGSDTLQFGAGIAAADLSVLRSGNDLVLVHTNGIDQVTMKNWFANGWNTTAFVDKFTFADGTAWTPSTLAAMEIALTGTPAGETLNGWDGSDRLVGDAGDDTLNGGNGNDVLLGGEGNDRLNAGTGNDTLNGGAGNDVLDGGNNGANQLLGGAGNDVLTTGAYANGNVLDGGTGDDALNGSAYSDTYLFNRGDGRDVITENWSWGGSDTLVFGPDIAPADLVVLRTGNDLVLALSDSTDQVTVKNWFANGWNAAAFIDKFSFADGTSWTPSTLAAMEILLAGTPAGETLNGWDGSDRLVGDAGDDTLNGGNGNDVLLAGEGNDRLNAGSGNDVLDGGAGNDVLDGGNNGANRLLGGAGNDVLTTGAYANGNVLAGGMGDDVLNGSAYSDTYVFNLGDGRDVIAENWSWGGTDTLQFGEGIAAADLSVLRSGNDLVLAHANGADQVTVKNWFANGWNTAAFIDKFTFADGTAWTPSTLASMPIALAGTRNSETLNGWDGSDQLIGDAGDDILNGGNGNDVLLGGEGNDRLNAGTGNDTLDGGAGNDVLDGGNNGANRLLGGAGDDVLTTGAYANGNVLAGGMGDDVLNGSAYSDTYVFNLGDGRDVINKTWSWGGTDTLQFGAGIATDQIWFARSGNSLQISLIGRDDSVTVSNWYQSSAAELESIRTSDGHALTRSRIDALVSAMAAFSPPPQGQTILPDSYQETLAPLIASGWN